MALACFFTSCEVIIAVWLMKDYSQGINPAADLAARRVRLGRPVHLPLLAPAEWLAELVAHHAALLQVNHTGADAALANAQVCTLQGRLLAVEVRVIESVRRARLHFASSYPLQALWQRLRPQPVEAIH